ncbi:MAG: hypothetical protein ACRDXX_16275 [Stackebrandtia sp.]
MIKDLSDAIESLRLNEAGGSDGHTKSALYTKLSGWNSEAVTNFKEVWLKGFNSAHGHQIIAIEALKSSLEACRDALLALRIDVDHIADATILALEDSGQDVPQALQIAGAVFVIAAGVAGIPVTGGASLAVTAQAVAAGFTIAAGVTSGIQSQVGAKGAPTGKAGSWTVSGDLVEDIIVSMKGSLNDAIIEFDNAKLAIGGALSSMSDAVDTKSRQKYLPPRPGIANATPGTATEFVS